MAFTAVPPPASTKPVRPAARALGTGIASFYGEEYQGNFTASGERFDMHQLTAAHRTLPFGTRVRVTHIGNGRSVVVRVNDRGPFVQGRVIDLSLAAARELGMVQSGLAEVLLELFHESESKDSHTPWPADS